MISESFTASIFRRNDEIMAIQWPMLLITEDGGKDPAGSAMVWC
jgi:hypothetical protein